MRGRRDRALESWQSELSDFRDEFPERLRRNMDAAMDDFTEALRESMPVRTGALKASGSWESDLLPGVYDAAATFGGPAAPYAPYVIGRFVDGEHGWDDVLPAFEPLFDAAIGAALRGEDF